MDFEDRLWATPKPKESDEDQLALSFEDRLWGQSMPGPEEAQAPRIRDNITNPYDTFQRGALEAGAYALSNPVSSSLLNLLDVGGRVVRTAQMEAGSTPEGQLAIQATGGPTLMNSPTALGLAIAQGGGGRIWDALWDPEQAATPTDVRRKYGFQDIGREGGFGAGPDGWSWKDALGDTVDFAGDMFYGAINDPLTPVTVKPSAQAGRQQTAARQFVKNLGPETEAAVRRAAAMREAVEQGGHLDDYMAPLSEAEAVAETQAKLRNQFLADSKLPPEAMPADFVPGPDWTGTDPSVFGRLAKGEEQISFLDQPVAIPQKIAPYVAPFIDPISIPATALGETRIGGAIARGVQSAREFIPSTKAGAWAQRQVDNVKDWFRNPATDDAAGLIIREGENKSRFMGDQAVFQYVEPLKETMRAAGIPADKWGRLGDYLELHASEGGELIPRFKTKAEEIVGDVASWTEQQQAGFYTAFRQAQETGPALRQRLIDEGVPTEQLGGDVFKLRDRLKGEFEKLDKEYQDALNGKPPEAPPGAAPRPQAPTGPRPEGSPPRTVQEFFEDEWAKKDVGTPDIPVTQSTETVAKVPVMVTRDMRQQLYDMGYTKADVDTMKPDAAWQKIQKREYNWKKRAEQEGITVPKADEPTPAPAPKPAPMPTPSPAVKQGLPEADIPVRNLGWKTADVQGMTPEIKQLLLDNSITGKGFNKWAAGANLPADMPFQQKLMQYAESRKAPVKPEAPKLDTAYARPDGVQVSTTRMDRLLELANDGSEPAGYAYAVLTAITQAKTVGDVVEGLKLIEGNNNATIRMVARALGVKGDEALAKFKSTDDLAKLLGVEIPAEHLVRGGQLKNIEGLAEGGRFINDRSGKYAGKAGRTRKALEGERGIDNAKASLPVDKDGYLEVVFGGQKTPTQFKVVPEEKLLKIEKHLQEIGDGLGFDVHYVADLDSYGLHLKVKNANNRNTILLKHGTLKPGGKGLNSLLDTFGHEVTHEAIATLPKEATEALLGAARKVMGDKKYDSLMKDLVDRYKKGGFELTEEAALEEILANAGGSLVRKDGARFLAEAAKANPSIIEHVIEYINTVIEKVQTWISDVDPAEAKQLEALVERLHRMQFNLSGSEKFLSEQQITKAQYLAEGVQAKASVQKKAPVDIEDLKLRRDAAEAAYKRSEEMAANVPTWLPFVAKQDLLDEYLIKSGKSGKGGASKGRSMRHGEGMAVTGRSTNPEALFMDDVGVPMTRAEAAREINIGGQGTKATAGLDPQSKLSIGQAVRKYFTKEGGAQVEKELKDVSFFSTDPVDAWAHHIAGSFKKAITNHVVESGFARTFRAIPVNAWEEVKAIAQQDFATWEQVSSAFKKKTGMDLESVLSPEAMKQLGTARTMPRSTQQSQLLADVFKNIAPPHGYAKAADFMDGQSYLPAPAMERFLKWKNPGKARQLTDAIPSWLRFGLGTWKIGQTAAWAAYHVRNLFSDGVRLWQEDAIDSLSGKDYQKLYGGLVGGISTSTGPLTAIAMGGRTGSKALQQTVEQGFGNFSQWKDVQFFGGPGALKSFGSEIVDGETLLKSMAREGQIGTGFQAQQLFDAADKVATRSWLEKHMPGWTPERIKKFPQTWERMKRAMAFREDGMKVIAVLARMRKGESFMDATLTAEKAMFNYASVSPAADFLRKTGIAPFVAWQAKNIPAQVEFMLRNPGKFAAALRALEMLEGEGVPEDAIQERMKSKYNLVVRQEKDGKGNTVWVTVTPSGVIPLTDLTELVHSGGANLLEQLGPTWKVLQSMYDQVTTPEGEPFRGRTVTEELIGKPLAMWDKARRAGTVNPRTFEFEASKLGILADTFNPVKSSRLAVLDSLGYEVGKWQREAKRSQKKHAEAIGELNAARLIPGVTEDDLLQVQERVTQSLKRWQTAQRKVAELQKTNVRTRQRVLQYNRAP